MPDAAVFQRQFARAMTVESLIADAAPSFAVYRNTWLKGLLDALDANYPTVATILGADLFKFVAVEFAREHPPATPVLALYGADFPDFLEANEVGREVPYIGDIARLERLWTECFFAPDAPAIEQRDYAVLRPAQMVSLRTRMHPATRFARFETPAVTIWQAHRLPGEFEPIEPDWRSESALVTRRGSAVSVNPIDDAVRHILEEIGRGQTLGLAITNAAETHQNADLAEAVALIMSSGALAIPQAEDLRIW